MSPRNQYLFELNIAINLGDGFERDVAHEWGLTDDSFKGSAKPATYNRYQLAYIPLLWGLDKDPPIIIETRNLFSPINAYNSPIITPSGPIPLFIQYRAEGFCTN